MYFNDGDLNVGVYPRMEVKTYLYNRDGTEAKSLLQLPKLAMYANEDNVLDDDSHLALKQMMEEESDSSEEEELYEQEEELYELEEVDTE